MSLNFNSSLRTPRVVSAISALNICLGFFNAENREQDAEFAEKPFRNMQFQSDAPPLDLLYLYLATHNLLFVIRNS